MRNVAQNYKVWEAGIDAAIDVESEDDFEDDLDDFVDQEEINMTFDPDPAVNVVNGDQNKEPAPPQPNTKGKNSR